MSVKTLAEIAEEEEAKSWLKNWTPQSAADPHQYKKCKNREKLQKYLRKFDFEKYRQHPYADVYFLMRYDDEIFPIAFEEFEDEYQETVCELQMMPMYPNQLENFVRSSYEESHWKEALAYESCMQKGNRHYEILCWESRGFLPQKTEILAILTESQCLDWLINYKYWHRNYL